MKIEEDFLAQLFKGDQLYVFQEDRTENAYDSPEEQEQSTPVVQEPKEKISATQSKESVTEKGILILVNQNLGQQEKETLNKLLKAIKIEEDEYDVIYEHPAQLKSIQHLQLFLSFHNQYVQSSDYAILKLQKGNAIYAHDLSELNKDTSKKLMLWNQLKTLL